MILCLLSERGTASPKSWRLEGVTGLCRCGQHRECPQKDLCRLTQALCVPHKIPGESTQMSLEPLEQALLRPCLKGFFQLQVKEVKIDCWKMPDPCFTNDDLTPAVGCLPSCTKLSSRAEGSAGLGLAAHPSGVTQVLCGPCIDVGDPRGPLPFHVGAEVSQSGLQHQVPLSVHKSPVPPAVPDRHCPTTCPCRCSTRLLTGQGELPLADSAKMLPKCLFHTRKGPGAAW